MVGAWKARWGVGRMSYIVPPGLYAIGEPEHDSPVVVTANYKMSYDLVRRTMAGRDVWLLVLETYGINVWCAAGKGTFGTGELVRRIETTGLSRIVSHRRVILPVMGASGVKVIDVKQRAGFEVLFATLRIDDLPEYLDNGMSATREMRELTFSLSERLVLAPVEIIGGMKSFPLAGLPLALLAAFSSGSFSINRFAVALILYLIAVLSGTLLTPLLLPLLPGRMFAVKGAVTGCACSLACAVILGRSPAVGPVDLAAVILMMTVVSSFYAMNYTGSTPFTSPSGVRREMQLALPAMAVTGGIAIILLAARAVFL
ncbi:MAG: acetyl-CoA synthase subunit gamma [Geobacteraceae bacterium]|nr:acetyl-CoA synthase subunit gamma [Geobacteraceae bacterium]